MYPIDRMTHDPRVMGGKACIRGMRVTISMILGQLASARSHHAILEDFPYMEREDIEQALNDATWLAEEREIMPVTA